MGQQSIGIGAAANDGTGDAPRTVGAKLNAMFSELYGGAGAGITIPSTIFDGVTDNTSAINAALSSGTTSILIPPGVTGVISAPLVIPNGVSLIGYNSTLKAAAAGTMVSLTATSAYGNRNGRVVGITLDGNNLATEGIYLGLCVSRTFIDVQVKNIAPSVSSLSPSTAGATTSYGAAWVLDATQNCIFINCGTNTSVGIALLMLNGAGGNAFFNNEMCFGSLANLLLDIDANRPGYAYGEFGSGAGPRQNAFYSTRFEYGTCYSVARLAKGLQNTFYDCGFYNGNSGSGSNVQIDNGCSSTCLIRPSFAPGSGSRTTALLNNGYRTVIQDPYIESYPSGSQVIQTANQLICRGVQQLSSTTYVYANISGNIGSNLQAEMPPIAIGSGDYTTYTAALLVPGMQLVNDTGRVWIYTKNLMWSELQQTAQQTFNSVTYTAGSAITTTYQLSGPGAYLVDVAAENGDDNHGRAALFSVRYSAVPSTYPVATVQKLGSDDVWGSLITALSATVSSTGVLTMSVTCNAATSGHVRISARRSGFVSTTG